MTSNAYLSWEHTHKVWNEILENVFDLYKYEQIINILLFSCLVGPKITEWEDDIIVAAGEGVSLDCQVVGDPPIRITWFKSGDELPHHGRTLRFENVLKLCFYVLQRVKLHMSDWIQNCYVHRK